jgi:hypothetical protein
MSKLVFRLNHVPDTEAEAVRNLLEENNFEFYETHAGKWGFSVAALWLKNDDDFIAARKVIDEFQQAHSKQMQQDYEAAKAEGRIPSFWQLIRSNPILYVSYWGLIVMVLVFSIIPIFGFFN